MWTYKYLKSIKFIFFNFRNLHPSTSLLFFEKNKDMSSENFLDKYGKPFIIGSLSGSVASAVIQPIDTTKVVIQNKREAAGKTKINLNPFHIAKEIIKENGVAGKKFAIFIGLYKGVDSAIMRQFIYCGMRLGLYKALEDRIRHKENRNLSFG